MTPASPHRRGEAGIGLVEVMVTALVVLLVTTATVTSIDFSQKQSGRTLARGITSNLAEADQERMRAMRAEDLIGHVASRDVQQGPVLYDVDSNAVLVQNESGSKVDCSSTGEQARFLRLTTTVTPPASSDGDPATVSSLYALPVAKYSATSGTLVVKVFRKDGSTGVPGVAVRAAGPMTRTGTTNAEGCVMFQFITAGGYSITATRGGYVDKHMEATPGITPAAVNPGGITTASTILEPAGSVAVTVDTNGAPQPFRSNGITVANSEILTTGKSRTFASATAANLFPFDGPYRAWSGTCAANDPSRYAANYFTANPMFGQGAVTAGGTTAIKVREPDVNAIVNVRRYRLPSNGKKWERVTEIAPAGLDVYLTQTDSGCGGPRYPTQTLADGRLTRLGYPFGTYELCADAEGTVQDDKGRDVTGSWRGTRSVANTAHDGTGDLTVTIDTTDGSTGSCS